MVTVITKLGRMITPGRPLHDMFDAELDAAKLDSTFIFLPCEGTL